MNIDSTRTLAIGAGVESCGYVVAIFRKLHGKWISSVNQGVRTASGRVNGEGRVGPARNRFDDAEDFATWWRMGDRCYRPETVEQLAKSMVRHHIAWLEEPIPPGDRAAYLRLKEKDIVALASGEHESGEDGYFDLILTEAVDYDGCLLPGRLCHWAAALVRDRAAMAWASRSTVGEPRWR